MRLLLHDLRHAARSLSRRPAFAAAAVLVLALGLGGTVAGFTILDATLLRPLPFPQPERLVSLYLTVEQPGGETHRLRWSHPELETLRRTLGLAAHREPSTGAPFEEVAAFTRTSFDLRAGAVPVHVEGEAVSPGYFDVLGVGAELGRTFDPEEDRVVLLGHELWRSRFGADPAVVGRAVRVGGVPLTVLGVLPPGFSGLSGRSQAWLPQAAAPAVLYPEQLTTHQHFVNVVARMREGASLAGAAAILERFDPVLAAGWGAEHPPGHWSAEAVPLDEARVDPDQRRARLILFGAALLVLLIAGADFAALVLGRGLARRRELAVRRALGSSRGRLVRQLLAESLLLALAGGAGGILLAVWLTEAASLLLPATLAVPANDYAQLAPFAELAVDGRVVAFAVALSVAAGLLFGLGPALRVTRRSGEEALHGGAGRGSAGGRSGARPFALLVVAEMALALTLLVGAALLLETLGHLAERPGAERPEEVISFRIEASLTRYGTDEAPELLAAVLARVAAVPGVRSATVGPCAPLTTGCAWREVRPADAEEGSEPHRVRRHYVATGHFETLGLDLLRGRRLSAADRPGRPAVAVINRRAAEVLWPGRDPLGRSIVLGEDEFLDGSRSAVVVGVVEDVPYGAPGEEVGLDLYTSIRQFARPATTVMARTAGVDPEALVPDLRRAVAAVDPDLPIHDVATLAERAGRQLAGPRFRGALLALFAALAVVLAGIGIYGVTAQWVGRRTHEMGVRIALGALRGQVLGLVVRRALALALGGVALGALGASMLSGLLASQLFGVEPADPVVFAGAAAFLVAAAALAVLAPARRATRVDPMETLRSE